MARTHKMRLCQTARDGLSINGSRGTVSSPPGRHSIREASSVQFQPAGEERDEVSGHHQQTDLRDSLSSGHRLSDTVADDASEDLLEQQQVGNLPATDLGERVAA